MSLRCLSIKSDGDWRVLTGLGFLHRHEETWSFSWWLVSSLPGINIFRDYSPGFTVLEKTSTHLQWVIAVYVFMVITLLLCHTHGRAVCVWELHRKVWVSVHLFPGDAFKCTVQLHVYEYLGIHMWWIRAVHQGWWGVWAVSSNRKSCTLAWQKPRSALYSTEGTHAPPAH